MVLTLDGFESHYMSHKALLTLHNAKILVVKEFSHTSQALQPFDDRPALASKSHLATWLPAFREHVFDAPMSQHDLLVLI